jgi:hypothetical protein
MHKIILDKVYMFSHFNHGQNYMFSRSAIDILSHGFALCYIVTSACKDATARTNFRQLQNLNWLRRFEVYRSEIPLAQI